MFDAIRRHYAQVAQQLSWRGLRRRGGTIWTRSTGTRSSIPISGIHRGSLAALHFARLMSRDVTAVLVDTISQDTARVREKWATWGHGVPLVVLESPYRSTVGPLVAYLNEVDRRDPERGPAVVVLPEFVPARWWHHLLHNQTAFLLKNILVYQSGKTGRDRVIINVPYHLRH